MGSEKTRDIHYISESNKNAILSLLRMDGPASRADISRKLGLSFPAVSINVKRLLEAGFLIEAGDANNAMGRKGKLLAVNTHNEYFVGLDIGYNCMRAMCADMVGKVLAYKKKWYTSETMSEKAVELIHETLKEAGVDLSYVAGIGVGIPGVYSEVEDRLLMAPHVRSVGGQSVIAYLRAHFTQKISVENSANLGVVGERWMGDAQGFDEVAYVDFGVGFSVGILSGGKLLRGANGAAGGIGAMTLERTFLRDTKSDEGALEQLIPSGQIGSIWARYEELDDIDLSIVKSELRGYLSPLFTEHMHTYFAMAIINTVALLNPSLVVISGRLGCALYDKHGREIDALISAHVPLCPKICRSTLREKANVFGAVALAAEALDGRYREFFG